MKILKLKFRNLNSLKGEWSIDFNNPAYINDGLFAIVGPTGAGKTTILDAICLSLYGRTPRLDSISKSSSEIMNRDSSDCYAQTTFVCEHGVFRSSFEQRHSRGNRDANLQAPKMELADDNTEEILESSKSQVPIKVAKLIGLNYEQFTRAVLLAQGQFKKFLESDANDRSGLLETITGTQIYSDISIKVFERAKEENAKLEALNQTLSGIDILSDDQQEALIKSLEESSSRSKTLKDEIDEVAQKLQWVKDVTKLKADLKDVEQNIAVNNQELISFKPLREQLVQDVKAQKIVADYRVTKQKRENLDKLDNLIDKDAETIKQIEEETASISKALDSANVELNAATAERNVQKPTIDKTKSLDTIIAEKFKGVQPEQDKLTQLQNRFSQECHKANISPKNLSDDLTTDKIESQISGMLHGISISDTRQIINGFNEKKERWKVLLDVKKEISNNENSIKRFQKELSEYSNSIQKLTKEKQQLESEKSAAEKYQKSLEKNIAFSKLFQSLEEHRKDLVEGESCPLCGATSHPYCQDVHDVALSKDENELEKTINHIRELQEQLSKAENNITIAKTQSSHLETNDKDLKEKNKSLQMQSDDICNAIPCDKDVSVQEVENRIRFIAQKTLQTQNNLNKAEIQEALKTPVLIREALNEKNSELKQIEDELNKLKQERAKLFGSNDPDKVLQKLSEAVDAAAKKLNDNKEILAALKAKQTSVKNNLEALQEERKTASKQYDESLSEFNMKLEKEQFSSADDFLKALLTDDQREDIQRRQKKLDEQQTSLNARNASIKENLLKLEKQNLTDKSEEELNQLNINRKTEYDSLLIDIGSKKAQLKTNEQRKKQYAQMHSQLEQQQAIAARWSNLNNIIGSADGKKYRRIVQKMSLEILIDYANDQMQVLAPRYQLTLRQSANDESDSEEKTKKAQLFPAGGKEELEIYCIDSWQSGAIRPTTNLSGGESFLVSLALALGLSKMSSRNRTLETLFLDEGFGSLDDATLQTALDAISQFQYSDETNKLVGIISHVDALKERIANKIEVSRTQAGVSALSGPGVTKEA